MVQASLTKKAAKVKSHVFVKGICILCLASLAAVLYDNVAYVSADLKTLNNMSGDANSKDMPRSQKIAATKIVDCAELVAESAAKEGKDFLFVTTKTRVAYKMSIYPPEQDVFVSKEILEKGCWECDIVERALRALDENKSRGAYLLDIGGNIGQVSLASAAAGHEVYTFEPVKSNYEHICRSIRQNGFEKRVTIFNRALASKPSVVQFTSAGKNFGGIAVRESKEASGRQGVDYAYAAVIDRLRDILPDKSKPVVLKVDIEGREMDALVGAAKFLREREIIHAFMELRLSVLIQETSKTDLVFSILRSKGLKPYRSVAGKLQALDPDWHTWQNAYSLLRVALFDVSWKKD